MANTPQSKKRARQTERRTEINKARRSRIRTFLRKVEEAIAGGDAAVAAEAERSGLVSRVVPLDKLLDEAMGAARKIAAKSAIAAMVAKEAVNRSYETTLREGLLFERRAFHALFATEDQKEGMSAFAEKREAQFRDR